MNFSRPIRFTLTRTSSIEIPLAMVRPEKYSTYAYVDLVEPGVDPLLIAGAAVLKQETYKNAEPWIVLTFLDIALP